MDTTMKPVPAFYGVYLLRSAPPRHSSLYVGSTPNPAVRLNQHNGKVKGGAVRTSRLSLRPWEMLCLVEGFPSNIAALQFEWAFNNAHLTTHISSEDRFSAPTTKVKTNKRTGKTRKKPGRPRASLMERVANLHLLLRSSYFSKWPLNLRCFSDVFYTAWQAWDGRISEHVRPGIKIILDEKQPEDEEFSSGQVPAKRKKADMIGRGGPEGIDPTYAKFQPVLLKLKDMIDNSGRDHSCTICSKKVDMRTDLYNLCLNDPCTSITHLNCMAARFLAEEKSTELLPQQGSCPSCHHTMTWSDLMRVLTLRTRADKQVNKLLKKRKQSVAAVAAELLEDSDSLSDPSDPESDSDASIVSALSAPTIAVIEDSEDEPL